MVTLLRGRRVAERVLAARFGGVEDRPEAVGGDRRPEVLLEHDADRRQELVERRQAGLLLDQRRAGHVASGGRVERALLNAWDGPLLAIPHPASRVLTTGLLVQTRLCLAEGVWGRHALRQRRGSVELETL